MVRLLLYLFNLIFVVFIGWLLSRTLQQLFGKPSAHFRASWKVRRPGSPPQINRGETARDPVCGMFVSTELSQRLTQGNQTLHFCSRECLERYQSNAAKS